MESYSNPKPHPKPLTLSPSPEQQAMESYCAIIEGLVSMMIATGALPTSL